MITCEVKVKSGGFSTHYTGIFNRTSEAAMDAISRYMINGKPFSFSVEVKPCNTKHSLTASGTN